MAEFAFGTAGDKRLREIFQQLLAGRSWGQQIAADAMDQLPTQSKFLLPVAIGQETEVANALKAFRQSVEQKAAQELVGGDGHGLRLLLVLGLAVIFPLKRNLAVFEFEQTLIGDGDAMGVTAEIFEHLFRAAERWFGIHHPLALFHGVQIFMKEIGITEMHDGAGKLELLMVEGVFEGFQKDAAEEAGQHLDR